MSFSSFIERRKTFLLYCVYGGMATAMETGLYYLLYIIAGLSNTTSTIVSWFLTVIFAFFTNKLFVYKSREWRIKYFLRELLSFFSARLTTGIFNLFLMLITVDYFGLDGVVMKVISALAAGGANYLIGLFVIFRRVNKKPGIEENEP